MHWPGFIDSLLTSLETEIFPILRQKPSIDFVMRWQFLQARRVQYVLKWMAMQAIAIRSFLIALNHVGWPAILPDVNSEFWKQELKHNARNISSYPETGIHSH